MRQYNIMNITQLFNIWMNDWYRYICRCIDYFKNRYDEQRLYKEVLLVYDIERDNITKLIQFLEMDMNIDNHWLNKSKQGWLKKHQGQNSHQSNIVMIPEYDKLEIRMFLMNTFNITNTTDLSNYNEMDELERICNGHLYQDQALISAIWCFC